VSELWESIDSQLWGKAGGGQELFLCWLLQDAISTQHDACLYRLCWLLPIILSPR
jgi:hypothetical protein